MTINTGDRKGQKNFDFMENNLIATRSPYHCLYHVPNTHLPFLQSFPSKHCLFGSLGYSSLFQEAAFPAHQDEMRYWQAHAFSQKAKVFNLVQQWYFTSRSKDSIILNIGSVTLLLDGESCTQTMYFKETVNVSRAEKSQLSALISAFKS